MFNVNEFCHQLPFKGGLVLAGSYSAKKLIAISSCSDPSMEF